MKRFFIRIAALGLMLLFCASATAQTAEDASYSMAEKLLKQLNDGSGFQGTLTITAEAVEGRESEAFSTIMPMVLDVSFIKVLGGLDAAQEARLALTLEASEYKQGNAELSLQDNNVYLQSSVLGDDWYRLDDEMTEPLLQSIGINDVLPAASGLSQTGGLMPGMFSFVTEMLESILDANTDSFTKAMEDYITTIDFWLESYRESTEMIDVNEGTSAMKIAYRLPAAAVKAQIKQLVVDLMNDEALLADLQAILPEDQVALYLNPDLQPYYFYAVDELPLEDDLTIYRVISLRGDTIELTVSMPLYDSVAGKTTLVYSRVQGEEDMPYENTLSIQSADSNLELQYRSYETINQTSVYQGTILYQSAAKEEKQEPMYWAAFDLSLLSQKTKDLRGYETQYETLKLSLAPAEIPDTEDAARYAVIPETDILLDAKIAGLAPRRSPTSVDVSVTVSGEDMAQSVTLALSGRTTGLWEPAAFDTDAAISITDISGEDMQKLLSQAVINGGLLLLPYWDLPQVNADNAE